jgi:restriction endonuclease S subunit
VTEIEALEKQEQKAVEEIVSSQSSIKSILSNLNNYDKATLESISENLDNLRKPVTKGDREKGIYPYYGASGIVDYVAEYLIDDNVLLISEDGANLKSRVYPIAFTATGKIWVNNHAHILKFRDTSTHKLAELYINQSDISEFVTGQAQPKLNQKNLNRIKIPLPPLSEQKKIVVEVEAIETKIAALQKQIAIIPQQKEKVLKKYL